jgi:subtilisin family serine protease
MRTSADPRRRRLAAATLLALLWAVALPAAAGAQARDGSLCGIVWPLDELLDCGRGTGVPPTPAPQPPSPQAPSREEAAGLPERPPPIVDARPRYVDNELLVRFRRSASRREREDALRRAGVTAVRTIAALGVTVVRMPQGRRDDALASLRRSPAVLHAERDAVLERLDTTPNDVDWPQQWGLRRIGLPAAWDVTRGLPSVLIAVLDTGIDGEVPDLRAAVVPGFNAVAPTAAPADDNGHGTSVAGIIAARANNAQGIAGICWSCTVLSVKVLAADGTGDTALVAAGIVRAVDAGARVITMSLGGPADDQTLDQAVAYALGKGAILVAAAGNNGSTAPFYPAAIPGVVGVAATDEADHLYSWSNYGSWVQLAAPGCNPAPSSAGGYVIFCGTSAAAPVVAGLIALQLSLQPGASRDTILAALDRTAVPLGGAVQFGRVDAQAALGALADTPAPASSSASAAFAATIHGVLRNGAARVVRPLPAGRLAVTLRFRSGPTLELTLRDARGALVARARSRSPLRLARTVAASAYRFSINGPKRRLPFVLELKEAN